MMMCLWQMIVECLRVLRSEVRLNDAIAVMVTSCANDIQKDGSSLVTFAASQHSLRSLFKCNMN